MIFFKFFLIKYSVCAADYTLRLFVKRIYDTDHRLLNKRQENTGNKAIYKTIHNGH